MHTLSGFQRLGTRTPLPETITGCGPFFGELTPYGICRSRVDSRVHTVRQYRAPSPVYLLPLLRPSSESFPIFTYDSAGPAYPPADEEGS